MKTFTFTIPGLPPITTAVLAPTVIVINRNDNHAYFEWNVYRDEAAMRAGEPPCGKVVKSYNGAEADKLKQDNIQLFNAIVDGMQTLGETEFGAT